MAKDINSRPRPVMRMSSATSAPVTGTERRASQSTSCRGLLLPARPPREKRSSSDSRGR